MNEKHSLLKKIKSNDILKKILNLAFPNIKSVVKFVAYDKVLLRKLDINIKDYYDCETKEIIKKRTILTAHNFINLFILFIPFLTYYILLYSKGIFKRINRKIDFNKKKKIFIDIFDNVFILLFLIYLIISLRLSILIELELEKKVFNKKVKLIIEICKFYIFLFYFIMTIIKYCFISEVIELEFSSRNDWYEQFNIVLIIFLIFSLKINICFIFGLWCCNKNQYADKKCFILCQINGLNIRDFELPFRFKNLNKNDIIKIIFKKKI